MTLEYRLADGADIQLLRKKIEAFIQLYETRPSVWLRGHFRAADDDLVFFDHRDALVKKIGTKYLYVEADGELCQIVLPAIRQTSIILQG